MLLRDEAADRRMAETPALPAYLPYLLVYPLKGHGLPVLLFLAVLLWFGMQSVLGIALLAVAAPWTFHYFEAVIEQSANGRATPPVFSGDMIFLGSLRAFRPLIGAGLIGAAYTLTYDLGPAAHVAVLGIGALLYPAFLLVLAIEGTELAALNPWKWVQAIVGVGPAYLLVCALMAGAIALAAATVHPAELMAALVTTIYLGMVVLHMLGYVAFHNAGKLGLQLKAPPPTEESRRIEEQGERLEDVLKEIDAALEARDLRAAGVALLTERGGAGDVRLFHEELFEEMQMRKKVELVHLQGARLITVLLNRKLASRALDIAETCYDAHKEFQPEYPEQAVSLAEAALQAKRLGLFRRLTHDAATRYAKDPAAVSLAFLTAKDAYDNGHDEARAREILKPLLAHTGHPWARQIAAYARALTPGSPR